MKPLLTIAIPTYNRAGDLGNLLASLVSELKRIPKGTVEVRVLDNASEDDTTAVVEKIQSDNATIHYARHKTNLGMQANFIECVRQSEGEYIYMIGDDEVILPGGLSIMLNAIESNRNVSVFVVNYRYEGAPEKAVFLQGACGHPVDTSVCNVKDFVYRHGWLWTFGNLGMVIAKTAPMKGADFLPHQAHGFMQAGLYLETFHNERMLFIDKPVFLTFIRSQTVNKDRWEQDGSADSWARTFDSVEHLINKGVLPPQLPLGFFNHCSSSWYPSWNLLLDRLLNRIVKGNLQIDDALWRDVTRWIEKVDNPAVRERTLAAIESLRVSFMIAKAGFENFARLSQLLRPTFSGT